MIVIFIIVAAWFTLMFVLKFIVRLIRKGAVTDTEKALAGETVHLITDNASYLGAEFPGPNLPPRTNGVLAITDTKLLFLPLFPRKAITLPKETITNVKLKDSFREMAYSIPLLTIQVKGGGDAQGTMAWLVQDAEGWEKEIKSVIRNP